MPTPASGVSDTGRLRALARDAATALETIAATPIPIRHGDPATEAALGAHELAVTVARRVFAAIGRPSERKGASRG